MMDELWKNFMETGSVVAYLIYKKSDTETLATGCPMDATAGQSLTGAYRSTDSYKSGEICHGKIDSDRHGNVSSSHWGI